MDRWWKKRKRFFTFWQRNSGVTESEELNTHVDAILQSLHSHQLKLQSLTGEYDVCVVFVSYSLQCFSFELDFEHQRSLTQLGIRTWFDSYIYEDVHKLMFDVRTRFGREAFDEE